MSGDNETAVARVDDQPQRGLQRMEAISPAALQRFCEDEKQRRQILDNFIQTSLVEDVDFGQVPGCGTKPFLYKAGAERIGSLLHLSFEFEIDKDTWIMLGKTPGTVCYICKAYTHSGMIAGEGRGVVEAGEKKWLANQRVKMAQKRAYVDCNLRVAGLSGRFTQDEDAIDVPNQREKPESRGTYQKPTKSDHAPSQRGQAASQPPGGADDFGWLIENAAEKISEPQFKKLVAMLKARDIDPNDFKYAFRFQHLHDLSWKSTKADAKYGTKSVYDELDAGTFDFLRKGAPKPKPAPAPAPPTEYVDLDTDDPFKNNEEFTD